MFLYIVMYIKLRFENSVPGIWQAGNSHCTSHWQQSRRLNLKKKILGTEETAQQLTR